MGDSMSSRWLRSALPSAERITQPGSARGVEPGVAPGWCRESEGQERESGERRYQLSYGVPSRPAPGAPLRTSTTPLPTGGATVTQLVALSVIGSTGTLRR